MSNQVVKNQKTFDEFNAARDRVKKGLTTGSIDPEEAIDALKDLGFSHSRAITLVDTWGEGRYVPYSVWSIIKTKG